MEVIELLVQIGEEIGFEQALISVETDKATMEIPAPVAGRLTELKVAEGDKVSKGSLIAVLAVSSSPAPLEEPEACLIKGAEVSSTDSQSPMPTSSPAGQVGDVSGESRIVHGSSSTATSQLSLEEPIPPYSSPSIRRLARELNVYLADVNGTGPRGRIIREDVLDYVRSMLQCRREEGDSGTRMAAAGMPDILPWPKVEFEKFGPVKRRALSRIRKISGDNLHRNWVSIPHVTNHEDADITELEAFRVELNAERVNSDVKVTLLALLIKACVAALKKFPEFNASLDGDEMVLKDYYHIGFAADTPHGLVVPVIREADQKGILEIAQEISSLAARAREGKLTIGQMSGGSFSISSLGGIGGTYFTPIINAPEVAILGVSRARQQVMWNGEAAEPRLILPLSLSWDHRVIDGAAAGRFNSYLASVLADMRRTIL